MLNQAFGKVRLTFKTDEEQLWIATSGIFDINSHVFLKKRKFELNISFLFFFFFSFFLFFLSFFKRENPKTAF